MNLWWLCSPCFKRFEGRIRGVKVGLQEVAICREPRCDHCHPMPYRVLLNPAL